MPPKGSKRKGKELAESKVKVTKFVEKERGDTCEEEANTEDSKTVEAVVHSSRDCKSPSPDKFNLKVTCWNVGGVRACMKKGLIKYIREEDADVICLQEVKCPLAKLPEEMSLAGYYRYGYDGEKGGYAGVLLYSKAKPSGVSYGLGIKEHDNECRLITAEYEKYFLVNVYVPNAGRGLVRLSYRRKWNKDFLNHITKLDAEKPVIICGDMNVSHKPIDLKNPKNNEKNAGFTPEEREDFTTLLNSGFLDTFRVLYPDETDCYTFWSYMRQARANNVGWRLDYFIISERLKDNLVDNRRRPEVLGSDHCPIVLYMSL